MSNVLVAGLAATLAYLVIQGDDIKDQIQKIEYNPNLTQAQKDGFKLLAFVQITPAGNHTIGDPGQLATNISQVVYNNDYGQRDAYNELLDFDPSKVQDQNSYAIAIHGLTVGLEKILNVVLDYQWAALNPVELFGGIFNGVHDSSKGSLLPPWLAPPTGMQQGNGGVMFPAGNGGGIEPLILDLNGDGAKSTRLGYGAGSLSTTYFDMDNDGFAERTAWVASGDGLLVMDKNGNGKIDNQTELFGNTATYANGFLNLKQYDSNSDNKITSADADGYYLTQSPQRHTEFTENSVSNDNHKNGGVIVRRMDAMRLAG